MNSDYIGQNKTALDGVRVAVFAPAPVLVRFDLTGVVARHVGRVAADARRDAIGHSRIKHLIDRLEAFELGEFLKFRFAL
jgi:hypothetical protein